MLSPEALAVPVPDARAVCAPSSEPGDIGGELLGVLRRTLRRDIDDVGAWRAVPLRHGPCSATGGLWRIEGELPDAGAVQPWSVVLKIIRYSTEGPSNWRATDDPSHSYYWRREALAYESGLVERFSGGLRAPRCLAVIEREDGGVALWMEDMLGLSATKWDIDRYGLAARHLGQAQGEFLAGRPLPNQDWLCRDWLRTYVERHGRRLILRAASATATKTSWPWAPR